MKAHSLQLVRGGDAMSQDLDWTLELEDYLDCLTAVLVGQVPYEERKRLREETKDHLICLVRDEMGQGAGGKEAFSRAVEAYGSSDQIAREYLASWFKKQAKGPLASRLGQDTLIGVGWMAAAQILSSALALVNVLHPGASALSYLVDPQAFYRIFPESIPAPEVSPLHLLMAVVWMGSPLAAGWMIGRSVPIGAGMAAAKGLIPCLAYSLVAGLLLLPSLDLVALGAVQAIWWLPAAGIVSHVSSAFAWVRRCRYRPGGSR